jgi:hypothetical protein
MRPIATVATPMIARVITRVFLRSIRSPMWLKMMPADQEREREHLAFDGVT